MMRRKPPKQHYLNQQWQPVRPAEPQRILSWLVQLASFVIYSFLIVLGIASGIGLLLAFY